MAETAVGLVVDKLIPLLTEEAHLLRGIHGEVEDIKCDLQFLLAFLKDADTRAERDQTTNNSHGVKVWVQKLREKAFEVEDVIDEYTHLIAQQRRPQKHKFIGFLRKGAFLLIKLKARHDIASKIQEIKRRVKDINEKRTTFGFNSTPEGSVFTAENNAWHDPRKDSCFLNESEVVGIESIRDELIAGVKDESTERRLISLVGMGGQGKTTLAHQVYIRVKGHFDYHAWIEVSKTYNNTELLRNVLKKFCQAREESVPEGVDAMDESTVTRRLSNYLEGKSYFIIFDDVWNSSFWAGVKNALPSDKGKSGRIMITTRYVTVANFCRQSARDEIRQLPPLDPEMAWELFCKRAFQYDFQGQCPTNLKKLSREIVKRCDGLPLAIVVIAGVLLTKNKTANEWRKFLTSLSSELESNEHLAIIEKILSLSYNDLPYFLKSCFLYLGIFPEGYPIRCRRLIRQWIAEGFVKPDKKKALEVVAEEYLAELINRSLVHVSKLDFDGRPKSCRIHDLLHDSALKKMEDKQFCQVLSRSEPKSAAKARRVSALHSLDGLESCSKTFHVRSLFMFFDVEMPKSHVCAIPTNFKLLKVLDFEEAQGLNHLPKDVGNLFHLRYLSIRGTRVQFLPKSIGKLENLETLDLKQSRVYELPIQINRLHKLRHLLAYNIDYKVDFHINWERGVKVEYGIGMLKALQKIYFIEADAVGVVVLEELSQLIELRKLGIKKLRREDGKTLCGSIQNMEHLESLDISSISENETLDLELSSPPNSLQRLYLKGHMIKFPEWITKLQNLVRVRIGWSKLEDDPLKALQHLPNLLELGISHDAYYGEKLHFVEGAFPKLKVLFLCSLSRLNLIVIEEGALCNLEEFFIGAFPQMKEVPSGFQLLKSLKLLQFFEFPAHFVVFQNFQNLEAVPDVRFLLTVSGQRLFLYLKQVLKLQKYIQEHDEVDWKSVRFEEVLRKLFNWKSCT